ncbi:hypothetical protein [Lonepinella sp. BR2357]|uniref:hypothetical protein n=1 Tax=Lonepinella sp. BR2357 TaxID=3434549 RepID=UPI003F6DC981
MKKVIVTALDNNDQIWYEHLVPFLISLKETDFDGDIGVIDYGLSENKIQILTEKQIKVFVPQRQYSELLMDRQISAAAIAEQYGYDALALYDADIWFPVKHLTVFDEVQENEKLYCSYDLWACGFLYTCVNQYGKEKISQEIEQIKQQHKYVWQAGVMTGTKSAWKEYRDFADLLLSKSDDFYMQYGIDATILNLYSVHENGVALLPIKYNCPPVWGIRLSDWGHGVEYSVENEPVQGLHVTRAHRKSGEFSYHKRFPKKYYEQGKAYQIKQYPYYSVIKDGFSLKELASMPNQFEIVEAFINNEYMKTSFMPRNAVYTKDSLLVTAAGSASIKLKNRQSSPQELCFYVEGIAGYRFCEEVYYRLDGVEHKIEPYRVYSIYVASEQQIELVTRELNVEQSQLRWVLMDVALHSC